jgi:hypothetical protein
MWNVRAQTRSGGKVSFEPDGLDASKACHISARGNVRSRAAGSGSRDVHLTGAEVGHEREIAEAIGLLRVPSTSGVSGTRGPSSRLSDLASSAQARES